MGELLINDPVQYQPTIGVVLGWQWAPRNTNAFTTALRWLTPSIGLHISTPQFGSRIYKFETDGGDVAIDERKNVTDIGIGAALGVWDDRVQLSAGKAVTALDRKTYVAVGFSFVSLVNGAIAAARYHAATFGEALTHLHAFFARAGAQIVGRTHRDGYDSSVRTAADTEGWLPGMLLDEVTQRGESERRMRAWVERLSASCLARPAESRALV